MGGQDAPEAKRRRISEANPDRCPNCGQPLGTDRVGSGRLSDGIFCSLECLATFHDDYFDERARGSRPSPS
jgi:hypothetical protein